MNDLQVVNWAICAVEGDMRISNDNRREIHERLGAWVKTMTAARADKCECVWIVAKVSDEPTENVFPIRGK
jgi:hypothetical protein